MVSSANSTKPTSLVLSVLDDANDIGRGCFGFSFLSKLEPSNTRQPARLMPSAAGVAGLSRRMCYSDNRSNSRANTCNKPRLPGGAHLLDKRLTRALLADQMIHDNSTDRTALVPATHHSNFCPINFRW